jgi:hypothetical protein
VRDLLRPGQGLRLHAVQAQHGVHKMQQKPEGMPHLQGQNIGLRAHLQILITLIHTITYIYYSLITSLASIKSYKDQLIEL